MGIFKGLISISNPDEELEYEESKKDKLHMLKMKLNALCLKKTGKPIQFKMEKLETQEGRLKFRS